MKKFMKKITSITLITAMLFTMAALTGCGGKEDETYVLVTMEAMGVEMGPEELESNMTLILKGNGDAQYISEALTEEAKESELDLTVDGSWEETDDGVSVTLVDGSTEATMEAVRDGDTLTFDDWLEA